MRNSENPEYLFRLTETSLLSEIANGRIDPKRLAEAELAARGLDRDGKFVGYIEANKLFGFVD